MRHADLCEAISGRRLVSLSYHGRDRIVEPHAYGRNSLGHELLRCYQESGGTGSGQSNGWKLLDLADALGIKILEERFEGPRQEYQRNDDALDVQIFTQL